MEYWNYYGIMEYSRIIWKITWRKSLTGQAKAFDDLRNEVFDEANYEIGIDNITWTTMKDVLGHFASGAEGLLDVPITSMTDPVYLKYCTLIICVWYRTLIANLPSQILLSICKCIKDIGTHSFRKGACTFALGIPSLSMISDVYLRVGWSLGNVKDRYISQSPGGDHCLGRPGGDHCLGRVLSGLGPNTEEFAALPPHFTTLISLILLMIGRMCMPSTID